MVTIAPLSNWPTEVTPDATFSPDTSMAGPSLEFAKAVCKQLEEKGLSAKAVTELGHSNEITAQQCMTHAKAQGFDGAFIVYYTGLSWKPATSASYMGGVIQTSGGFLYIPNAAFYEV